MAADNTLSGKIVNKAADIAAPFARQLGLELWDVRFLKEGSEWYLRYYIDKPGGVGIDDCEALSRAIDKPLDDADFIDRSYYLEVSSPGLGRRLTRPEHFISMLGHDVTVRLIHADSGTKELSGTLSDYSDGMIMIDRSGTKTEIPKAQTAFVKLNDDIFDLQTDTEE